MHSRLPHFAGVHGRLSVAAVTAALLVSGCAPNFHAPETSSLAPASDTYHLPQTVKNTADTTMRDAAAAVAQQLTFHYPAAAETDTDDSRAEEPPSDGTEETPETGEDAESEGATSSRAELQQWSEALTRAYETAEEEAEREPTPEAEPPTQSSEPEEDEPSAEDEPQEELPEPEPDPEPEPEPETPTPEPEPPAESSEVSFDGDLDAFLRQIASAYPGTISISLQEVGGQSRSASTGGADSFVTASTYKLLVGYSLIREVEAGELSWDDTAHGDKDLAQCFNDMIVLSDNPCPEAIGPAIGWSKIYADAAAVGATSTSGGEGGIRTNAADLTRFMTSLATGSMSMSEAGHERLRNALAANIHREGIPAGSAGRVLNKPGFINGNLHDTAIVHHPSGTYVLTILSQGSNWHALAGITRDIESALYG